MNQPTFQVAIIGFGTVGEGVYRTLERKAKKIEALLGRSLHIPFVLVKSVEKDRDVLPVTKVTNRLEDLLEYDRLDVVVEASPDAETAYPFVTELLRRGVSVISANKELMAKYGEELHQLATDHRCHLLYEAAVAGGIPLLNTIRHTLKTNTVDRLEGILNGTSNFMLTKMREEGASFPQALREAQEKGYAEAVPDKDVDGWDAYFKTTILSHWIYGKAPVWKGEPKGIRHVTVEDISLANQLNGRIKHVASLVKVGDNVEASVEPCLVLNDHLLYGVEGVNNGIHIEGSIVGSVMLQGPGAGKYPTASAIVEDLVNLLLRKDEKVEEQGIEFVEHGFSEKVLDDSSYTGLWFVTGNEALLSQWLTSVGAQKLTVSSLRPEQKTGAIVYLNFDQQQALEAFGEDIQLYPVLTNIGAGDIVGEKKEEKKTVSF
ncbi:homoserine dehydrogenase [Evansella vedderi]|uniref:Homoserine dehydrogenase n=1 Tax=Evansella vedderi TaxID=38282 RepID=A0ABT9ZTR8_9BACI|nr:homoserine dehydrogenase [Evansella vedderi]MDQ0254639.1 homoserine dehydrogenase [Evansella vedderi]